MQRGKGRDAAELNRDLKNPEQKFVAVAEVGAHFFSRPTLVYGLQAICSRVAL